MSYITSTIRGSPSLVSGKEVDLVLVQELHTLTNLPHADIQTCIKGTRKYGVACEGWGKGKVNSFTTLRLCKCLMLTILLPV